MVSQMLHPATSSSSLLFTWSIKLSRQVNWRYSLNVTWSFVSPFFLLGYKFTVGTWRTWLILFCWWALVLWPIDLMGTGDISEDFAPLLSLKFFVTVMRKWHINILDCELQDSNSHLSTPLQTKPPWHEAAKTYLKLFLFQTHLSCYIEEAVM